MHWCSFVSECHMSFCLLFIANNRAFLLTCSRLGRTRAQSANNPQGYGRIHDTDTSKHRSSQKRNMDNMMIQWQHWPVSHLSMWRLLRIIGQNIGQAPRALDRISSQDETPENTEVKISAKRHEHSIESHLKMWHLLRVETRISAKRHEHSIEFNQRMWHFL
jgi:hypothetical protein